MENVDLAAESRLLRGFMRLSSLMESEDQTGCCSSNLWPPEHWLLHVATEEQLLMRAWPPSPWYSSTIHLQHSLDPELGTWRRPGGISGEHVNREAALNAGHLQKPVCKENRRWEVAEDDLVLAVRDLGQVC